MKSRVLLPVIAAVSLLFLQAGAPRAQAPQVSARWEPGVFHLGDPAELDIELPVKVADFYVEGGLSAGSDWGDGRIRSVEDAPPPAFPGTLKLRVKVQLFKVGEVQLPPAKVTLRLADGRESFTITPPPLHVTPLLPPGPQPEPPPANLIPIPASVPWLIIAGTAVVLVLFVLLLLYFVRRAMGKETPKPAEIPLKERDSHRWILSEVERLFRTELPLPTRYEILSKRLREYLELTMSRPFLEWTTTEIHKASSEIERLSGKPSARLVGVLRFCDSVLFARFAPEKEEEEETRLETFRLLEEVAPRREEERLS